MNFNKKLVALGIILLIIVWAGNIVYYENHVLKEPIFLKHYYDIREGMQNMQLYYIDNLNSKDKVVSITFPELGSMPTEVNESNYNSDRRYYVMKRLDVAIYRGDPNKIPQEYINKLITKADVLLSSGKVIHIDIGKIYIYTDNPAKNVIKTLMASGSSDNITKSSFDIKKDLKVSGISCKFPELLGNAVDLEVNGKSFKDIKFPIELKNGQNFQVEAGFNLSPKDIRKNNVYNFFIDFQMEDTQGNKSYAPFNANYWLQFPQQYDIKALLKEGGRM